MDAFSSSFLVTMLGVFGAGVLATLSPCVYVLVPLTVGYFGQFKSGAQSSSISKKALYAILGFFIGQTLAFVSLGILAVSLGEVLGFSAENNFVNLFVGVLLLSFGIVSMLNFVPAFFNNWNSSLTKASQSFGQSFLGALVLGFSSSLVASPCTSPVLGGVLTVLSTDESYLKGIILMTAYSFGFGSLILVTGFGLLKLKSLPKSGHWLVWIHRVSTVFLIILGCYFIYKSIQL